MNEQKTTPGAAEPKPGYYAVIPANVRYDDRLPGKAALLYGEITALANAEGYCWASNNYFAALYHVSPQTVRLWLKALEDAGYIRREDVRDETTNEVIQRRLWLCDPSPKNLGETPIKNQGDPPIKNLPQNNTSNNNTPYSPPEGDEAQKKPNDDETPKKPTIAQQREHWFKCCFKIYPNHNALAPALKKWMRMKPSHEFAQHIFLTIQAQKAAQKWSDGYWPEFRKWLLDERWNDELPSPKAEGGGQIVEDEGVTYW